MLRAVLISLFTFAEALLGGCWQGVSRDVVATVLSVRGEVVCASEAKSDFRLIGSTPKLGAGSVVRTLSDARLDLSFLPGVLAQVSSNSEIEIHALEISKDGNETGDAMRNRVARLRMNRGQITVLCIRRGEMPSQFTIATQQATITADSDCLFYIQSDGTKTRVTCARGKIYASETGPPMAVIEAGNFQEWPSRRSTPIPAAEDNSAQIEMMNAIQAGSQLEKLQSNAHSSRPF